MSDLLKSFWPDDILPPHKVLSPLLILRQAAAELPKKSGNVYESEVSTTEEFDQDDTPWLVHTFVVIAPGLNRYARTLFRVEHRKDQVYPADLLSNGGQRTVCHTQDELMSAIQTVLASPATRSIFYSLAAKLNEASVAN